MNCINLIFYFFFTFLIVGCFVVIKCYNQKYCLLQALQDSFGKHGKKRWCPQQYSSFREFLWTMGPLLWPRSEVVSEPHTEPPTEVSVLLFWNSPWDNKVLHVDSDCLWMTNPFLSLASYTCVCVFATILCVTSKCSRYQLTLSGVSWNLNTRIMLC